MTAEPARAALIDGKAFSAALVERVAAAAGRLRQAHGVQAGLAVVIVMGHLGLEADAFSTPYVLPLLSRYFLRRSSFLTSMIISFKRPEPLRRGPANAILRFRKEAVTTTVLFSAANTT